jgi:Peptidase A4 family
MEHHSPRPRRHGGIGAMITVTAITVGCVVLLTASLATAKTPSPGRHSTFRVTDRYHQTVAVTRFGTRLADSQSSNWSGYNEGVLDTETLTSSISAQWVVPTATQHTPGQAEDSATWIGIGGGCLQSSCTATDNTLIQAGTEQDVSASGQATYDAWYEIIPVPEIASTIAVNPGDVITCSISQLVPGIWTITLNDATDGQGFTQTVPYTSDESTAEWIEETPTEIGTSGTGLAALPNLTTVQFSKATVNGASAGLQADQALQLIDSNGNPIATPSAPVTGNGFNDCAWATTCAAP